jgi:hypothetical protein
VTPGTAAYEQPTFVGPVRVDPDKPLSRGDVVGRYVVVAQIGRGGMGVVYSAYDPELDRKVAIKILLGSSGETSTVADARTRLVREAQALAQLSHPAVVAIHDVGTYGDRVWLAMEFIDGVTLGAWPPQYMAPEQWLGDPTDARTDQFSFCVAPQGKPRGSI